MLKLRVLLLALFFGLLSCLDGERFQLRPVAISGISAPKPRSRATLVSVIDELVLFGGKRGTDFAWGDTWIFNTKDASWQEVVAKNGSELPSARYGSIGANIAFENVEGNFVYIVGGYGCYTKGGGYSVCNDVWGFDVRGRRWFEVDLSDSNVSVARTDAIGGGTTQSTILVSHGWDGKSQRAETFELRFQNPEKASWSLIHKPVSPYYVGAPRALTKAASVVTPGANELVSFGGCYKIGLCPNQDAWSFDTIGSKRWRLMKRGPGPRTFAALAQALPEFRLVGMDRAQTVVLFGGVGKSKQLLSTARAVSPTELAILNVRSKSWTREQVAWEGDEAPLKQDFGIQMFAIARNLSEGPGFFYLIFGGQTKNGIFVNSLMRMNFDASQKDESTSSSRYEAANFLVLHGICMAWGLGFVLPFGGFSARYMKIYGSGMWWYFIHWSCQIVGFAFAWLGLVFKFIGKESSVDHAHAILGIAIMSLLTLQMVVALPGIRPHPDASRVRKLWAVFHRWNGRTVFAASSVNIALGLFLLYSPPAVWIFWACFAGFMLILWVLFELIGLYLKEDVSRYQVQTGNYSSPHGGFTDQSEISSVGGSLHPFPSTAGSDGVSLDEIGRGL